MDLRWTWMESWALSQVADLLQLQTSKEPELRECSNYTCDNRFIGLLVYIRISNPATIYFD